MTLSLSSEIPKSAVFRTRIAPTPSGYLHLGNCMSFLLTWAIAKANGGELYLRIDDIDKERRRIEYIEDIFSTLDFLGIDYHKGPQNVSDFLKNYSQHTKLERYKNTIEKLAHKKIVYPCVCSRKNIQKVTTDGIYPGVCKQTYVATENKNYALRIKVNEDYKSLWQEYKRGIQAIDLSKAVGDFIVQSKNKLPSYQVVSVCDDIDMKINFIVRGKDLVDSTACQIYLSEFLEENNFKETIFYHHELMLDKNGEKMSKSKKSVSLKHLRNAGFSKSDFFIEASRFLGLKNNPASNLNDFYSKFKNDLTS